MSEKEKEMEEEEVIHWSHNHPLTSVETRVGSDCYGCGRYFSSGEQGYGCSKKCEYTTLLDEECVEMPRKIRHPLHPQHILIIQQDIKGHMPKPNCAICHQGEITSIGYYCTSSKCEFQIHMRCAQDSSVMDADDDDQSRAIQHPYHPHHQLTLMRRARGSYSFKCHACGTTHKGNSYLCITCQYWIHCRCASLPHTIKREDHHHSLSLSFRVPPEYIKFDFKCDVCHRDLMPKYWIYHCQLCRYVVHINCVFKKSPHATITNLCDGKDLIQFPINDVAEEQIRRFVVRVGGTIAPISNDDEIANVKYEFHSHKHQLSLIISSSSHDGQNEEEENNDDEDEDDDYGQKSKLICDGCTTPIFQKKQIRSSNKHYYYMSCSECKYFLHLACFHLPPQLPSLPLHHQPDHELVLQSCAKLEFEKECSVCQHGMNGLFYACTETGCSFKADIKCASLPDTIHHAAHPQHLLKHIQSAKSSRCLSLSCAACCDFVADDVDCYVCDNDSCAFMLHVRCAVLPPSATKRRWDKQHPLPLTYNASVNHPDEFYCDQCEGEMNPKMWMYHCRHCDLSFHPRCFPATSGQYRNIKFGHQYEIAPAPSHLSTSHLKTLLQMSFVCV